MNVRMKCAEARELHLQTRIGRVALRVAEERREIGPRGRKGAAKAPGGEWRADRAALPAGAVARRRKQRRAKGATPGSASATAQRAQRRCGRRRRHGRRRQAAQARRRLAIAIVSLPRAPDGPCLLPALLRVGHRRTQHPPRAVLGEALVPRVVPARRFPVGVSSRSAVARFRARES